ncbi:MULTISPECIES: hypothetical protein [unclassified Gilliamella]|uniref:hypothetical protein n=1 Tax=unclassified Gilliamella TaxID=2685620 RepID=UPI002269DBBC|nr:MULTISPECIES: hypothetical protein [unclassified Gilliamella]MCX8581395.1 hypothetical protein [Gilliamella sp. B3482]MCX8594152.1 hypothetical protein [Gilliamella sp. B3367]MCX8662588.1 hypothetical protein [Gilliamella sp. B2911]MCX8682345.1 hypothetical protein [Gilliamella sp. B2889]
MLSSDPLQNSISKTDLEIFCHYLSISRQIDIYSMLLSVLGAFVALISFGEGALTIFCLIIFLLGLVSKYYAIRVAFDKKLFEYLANHSDHLQNELLAMDKALINLKLINAPTLRTVDDRQKGVLSLLRFQIILFLLQNCLIVFAVINGIINN